MPEFTLSTSDVLLKYVFLTNVNAVNDVRVTGEINERMAIKQTVFYISVDLTSEPLLISQNCLEKETNSCQDFIERMKTTFECL